jgi:hypothetical protein
VARELGNHIFAAETKPAMGRRNVTPTEIPTVPNTDRATEAAAATTATAKRR